jgi:hypothetical protein
VVKWSDAIVVRVVRKALAGEVRVS